jgi:hypothetical protein
MLRREKAKKMTKIGGNSEDNRKTIKILYLSRSKVSRRKK